MSDTPAPRWRVTFRRAGEPKTTDTLVIAGMDSMVSALKEAQMMLAEKAGGPWVVQAIEEIEPVETPPLPDTAKLGDALERATSA